MTETFALHSNNCLFIPGLKKGEKKSISRKQHEDGETVPLHGMEMFKISTIKTEVLISRNWSIQRGRCWRRNGKQIGLGTKLQHKEDSNRKKLRDRSSEKCSITERGREKFCTLQKEGGRNCSFQGLAAFQAVWLWFWQPPVFLFLFFSFLPLLKPSGVSPLPDLNLSQMT